MAVLQIGEWRLGSTRNGSGRREGCHHLARPFHLSHAPLGCVSGSGCGPLPAASICRPQSARRPHLMARRHRGQCARFAARPRTLIQIIDSPRSTEKPHFGHCFLGSPVQTRVQESPNGYLRGDLRGSERHDGFGTRIRPSQRGDQRHGVSRLQADPACIGRQSVNVERQPEAVNVQGGRCAGHEPAHDRHMTRSSFIRRSFWQGYFPACQLRGLFGDSNPNRVSPGARRRVSVGACVWMRSY
jgi:hypothetical protein